MDPQRRRAVRAPVSVAARSCTVHERLSPGVAGISPPCFDGSSQHAVIVRQQAGEAMPEKRPHTGLAASIRAGQSLELKRDAHDSRASAGSRALPRAATEGSIMTVAECAAGFSVLMTGAAARSAPVVAAVPLPQDPAALAGSRRCPRGQPHASGLRHGQFRRGDARLELHARLPALRTALLRRARRTTRCCR